MDNNQLSPLVYDGGYYFSRSFEAGFDEVMDRLRSALQQAGFGIQWETNVQGMLQDKLGLSMARYTIVGACRPEEAAKAFAAEPWIGVLMPCNAVVRESADGSVEVGFKHPRSMAAQADNHEITALAEELTPQLEDLLARL